MDRLTDLISSGKLIESVGKVVDQLNLPPEEKQAFELEMKKAMLARDSDLEQKIRQELQMQSQTLADELQAGDRFTRWARPAIVWAGLLFIFLTNVVFPAVAYKDGKPAPEFKIDPAFWNAWTITISVWAGGRTVEKMGFRGRILELITGSKAQPAAQSDSKPTPFDVKG